MSIKIMSQVWPLQLGLADKMVLLSLADTANDEGLCWPSIESLCLKTCLSDRAVQQCVKRLSILGYVNVSRRYKQSNIYQVYPEPRSPEAASPEVPSPEYCDNSTPNHVHPQSLKKTLEPSKKNRKKLATSIDPEFMPDEKLQLFAIQRLEDPDIGALREQFVAHHQAKGTLSKSWDASWRTWVINALKYGYPKLGSSAAAARRVFA